MAAIPTTADLQALIATLQAQVNALSAAAPAAAVPTPVVFADTPQMLNSDDLIDYLTKRGSSIYEQGCKALKDKALTDRFGMTPDQTVVFAEALSRRATTMGWNQGTKEIITHQNSAGTAVDIIKCYGRIDKGTLKASCERFCGLEKWMLRLVRAKQHDDGILPLEVTHRCRSSQVTHLSQ
jgi:hypothetical protein